jgi:hypothetical protein
MAEIVTYSLHGEFYRDVAALADEFVGQMGSLPEAYLAFARDHEQPRSRAEYGYEALVLGVLWKVYAARAAGLNDPARRMLTGLVHIRQGSACLKPAADALRGLFGTLVLTPFRYSGSGIPDFSPARLDGLLGWLGATGDYDETIKRLRGWHDFLAGLPDATKTWDAILCLVVWFEARSLEVLGRYTSNVETFLEKTHPRYRWREDAIFTGRPRVEYHLNMLGTELLNRAFREAFLQTKKKIVILPPCMRTRSEDECKAVSTPLGEHCAACTPGCHVHQATKLGEKYGFEVFIMPHEISVFSGGGRKPTAAGMVGIVGVSCPLTNPSGGWETRALGIPAQGLLLDYCGCRWHWHEEGIPTGVDFGRLLELLDVQLPVLEKGVRS